MGGQRDYARHLRVHILSGRIVRRLWYQHILPDYLFLRHILVVEGTQSQCTPTGKDYSGAPHQPHTAADVGTTGHRQHNFAPVHCLYPDPIHRQHSALAGQPDDVTEHRGHVDVGTQICGAVVGVDCGGCRQCRTLYI